MVMGMVMVIVIVIFIVKLSEVLKNKLKMIVKIPKEINLMKNMIIQDHKIQFKVMENFLVIYT